MKKNTLVLCAIAFCLLFASCGGAETDTSKDAETESSTETVIEENTGDETETNVETNAETEYEYVHYDDLTAAEIEGNPNYDSTTGVLTVRFDDPYVIYKEGEPCEAGFSGGGAAYFLTGTIDMTASDAMKGEDGYYTGVCVKLTAEDEPVPAGSYKMILQFSSYSVTTTITIDSQIG